MKTRRLAPGYYEVDTPFGTATVVYVEPDSRAWPPAWMVTYPGCRVADSAADTLRQAKQWLAGWVEEVQAGRITPPVDPFN